MLSATYKSFMLSAAYKPFMLSVIMLNVVGPSVVMLSVVAPLQQLEVLHFNKKNQHIKKIVLYHSTNLFFKAYLVFFKRQVTLFEGHLYSLCNGLLV
jgi:hypothetical protein